MSCLSGKSISHKKEVYLNVLNVTVIAIKFPSDEFHAKQLQSEWVISRFSKKERKNG